MRYIKYAVALMSLLHIKGTNLGSMSSSESKALSHYKGVNIFPTADDSEDEKFEATLKSAKKNGAQVIRLALCKLGCKHKRDFLIGDCNHYKELVPDDLKRLKRILEICYSVEMPVILVMLSLPGSRWKQLNSKGNSYNNKQEGDTDDLRIWLDEELVADAAKFWKNLAGALKNHPVIDAYKLNEPHPERLLKKYQFLTGAARFWKDLAEELRGHPAILAYNILNEPHPEALFKNYEQHTEKISALLYNFNIAIVNAIRSVDRTIPMIVSCSNYADPQAFDYLKPIEDKNVIYSFHMAEPFAYGTYQINYNPKLQECMYKYPGRIEGQEWNKEAIRQYIQPAINFCNTNEISLERMLAGEFGVDQRVPGAAIYMRHIGECLDEIGISAIVYSWGETWEGRNYVNNEETKEWLEKWMGNKSSKRSCCIL